MDSLSNIPDTPSRRQLLCGAVVLVAGGVVVTACGTGQGTPDSSAPGSGQQASGTVLAAVSDVPVGGGVVVTAAGGVKVLLVQPSAGQIKAFNATCPHAGVTVAPPVGDTITCPGHGSQFNAATGALKRGPATTGLTAIAVKVSGSAVVIA